MHPKEHPQAIMVKFDSSKMVGEKDKPSNPWFTFLGQAVSSQMHGGLVIIDNVSKEWKFITRESFPNESVRGKLGEIKPASLYRVGDSVHYGVVCLDDRAGVLDFVQATFLIGYNTGLVSKETRGANPDELPP